MVSKINVVLGRIIFLVVLTGLVELDILVKAMKKNGEKKIKIKYGKKYNDK